MQCFCKWCKHYNTSSVHSCVAKYSIFRCGCDFVRWLKIFCNQFSEFFSISRYIQISYWAPHHINKVYTNISNELWDDNLSWWKPEYFFVLFFISHTNTRAIFIEMMKFSDQKICVSEMIHCVVIKSSHRKKFKMRVLIDK